MMVDVEGGFVAKHDNKKPNLGEVVRVCEGVY